MSSLNANTKCVVSDCVVIKWQLRVYLWSEISNRFPQELKRSQFQLMWLQRRCPLTLWTTQVGWHEEKHTSLLFFSPPNLGGGVIIETLRFLVTEWELSFYSALFLVNYFVFRPFAFSFPENLQFVFVSSWIYKSSNWG